MGPTYKANGSDASGRLRYKVGAMAKTKINPWAQLMREVQRRVPARQQLVQEAFTSDHRHTVMVKLSEVSPDTFYWFDERTACACFDAVMDAAVRQTGGRLMVSYTTFGEVEAQIHRLQHAASKLDKVQVLAVGKPNRQLWQGARLEWNSIANTPLARYRLALAETREPFLFIAREEPVRRGKPGRSLGFLSTDVDVVEEMADDVEVLLRGYGGQLEAFEKLRLLHETTQQVSRALESYARRMELAVERAQRRPDLLTPARFERIVTQAIAKMEELKEIPLSALRTAGKPKR